MADIGHRLRDVSATWYAAAAGAALAGAALFPQRRVLAGLVAGIGVLAVAVRRTPCCSGCAQGRGCAGAAIDDEHAAPPPSGTVLGSASSASVGTWDDIFVGAGSPVNLPTIAIGEPNPTKPRSCA